jgi:kynurenine formamidase
MFISFEIENRSYKIDAEKPIDISIPLKFNGDQPNAYGVEKATSNACEAGSLIGDTRRGGSCNFEQVTFIPHCNGTHTECVGHITKERISIRDCLRDAFVLAVLISVTPEKAEKTKDSYSAEIEQNNRMITRKSIENALENLKFQISDFRLSKSPTAVAVRTLPNDNGKMSKIYDDEIPPFFSTEAIEFLAEIGINHLLVDLPSIDRIFDEGMLSNHRIFWNVEQGSFEAKSETRKNNTITELIFVPDSVKDGDFLLNLQIAPFHADASPSRPTLFEIF